MNLCVPHVSIAVIAPSPRAAIYPVHFNSSFASTPFVRQLRNLSTSMKNRPESTTSTAETPEQLIEHISRLMAEAEAMIAGPVTEQAGGKLSEIKNRLESARERLNEVYGRARTSVIAGAKYTDDTIRQYPYQSLAVALGIGVLIGALIRGGRNNS
jgi:ElaB/YqjD/DUF883 family membrane-anchored ribosome-binding protein